MRVVYCQHPDTGSGAERAMVAALGERRGVLLVNPLVTSGRRTREIDGIWLHPDGLVVLEAKGTALRGELHPFQNGPWTIGGTPADFAGGPNPLLQARTAAQTLRRALTDHGTDVGFLPAAVVVSGTAVACTPQLVGDMAVVTADRLDALPALLEGRAISVGEVVAVLDALDLAAAVRPTLADLDAEGFAAPTAVTATPADRRPTGPSTPTRSRAATAAEFDEAPAGTGSPAGNSKDRRRARRLGELQAQAQRDWRGSHRRRIVASAIAAAVMVGYLPFLPAYTLAHGALLAALTGSYQLHLRAKLTGPRDRGPVSAAGWLLSLLPVAGAGASLAWLAALPTLAPAVWPFVMMLSILTATGLACAILAGRSAFVHPPQIVIERYDERGRPTGAFMLARCDPDSFPGAEWRPVADPPAA